MMGRTDRHFRFLVRQFSRRCLLYSEMLTSGAILHGDLDRLLGHCEVEHPLAIQLGGDDPAQLAECARIVADRGFEEVNLNVGCPSDRVQSGRFGACLMAQPGRVAACVEAMRRAVPLPVTVKHRIGIEGLDRHADLLNFVDVLAAAGCDRFIVHARTAILHGLSPTQNRSIPPLRYDDVFCLKQERPGLRIELNGGIQTLAEISRLLERVDGVMVGRAAYAHPELLLGTDPMLYGAPAPSTSLDDVMTALLSYADDWTRRGGRLHDISRHLVHLFAGQPGARSWRRHLSEKATSRQAGAEVLAEAWHQIRST